MSNFGKFVMHATVMPGAEISECCKEAILIALNQDCIVMFVHNEHTYTVNPKTLIEVVWNTSK